ncbi:MAG: choice-of-anchor D domain-containing protein, partial [Bacteroidota bacterium]
MKKSYTILTVFLLMIIGSSGAFAQILLEDFDYTAGDSLNSMHNWTIQATASYVNTIKVVSPGLSYPGYASSLGNAAKIDTTGQDIYRSFTGQTSGNVYVSFLVNISKATTTGDYFFHFTEAGTTNFRGRIYAKLVGTDLAFGLYKGSAGTLAYTPATFALNTTYLMVLKYKFNTVSTTDDSVYLYINPTLAGTEPNPDLSFGSTDVDLATVSAINLRQGTAANAPRLVIDGIRVGTSWSNSVLGVLESKAVFNKKTASYGKVNVGNSVFDTVTVTNSGMATLNISAVTSGSGLFVVNPLSATILTGASQKFSMKFTPTATAVTNSAVVFTSNAPSSPDSVTVSGEGVQAGFTLSRSSISFGTIWKDSTATDSVIITNIGKTSHLLVDSVRSTNSLFTVLPSGSADLDTSASKTYVVKFSPTSKGAQSGSIVFFHNAPSLRDTVKVTGSGKIKEALFTATPVSLNFGAILKGKTKKDSITIKNTGNDSLFITSVASSNNQFTLTPSSARLDTSASQKFYVTFAPTSTGIQATALVFTTNTAEVTDTVKAKGTSVPAVTIAEARKDTNSDFIADHSVSKDTLVIYGVITSPNFQSTQTSYFIQDSSAGINIFSFTLTSTNFAIGDSVFVIGYVAQFRGLTEFTPLTVDSVNFGIIKHNAIVPKPKRLTLHQFVLSPESYEGQLIEVDTLYKATGTWPAAGAYASVYVTNVTKADTAQMFLDNDTNIDGSVEPEYPLNVVGIVSQYSSASTVYNNGYEIMPRDTADINPPQPVVRMASTLTTSKIQTTVTNVGHIGGLNDFQDKVGVKFGGMERMFEGSFIFTTDSAHVSNAWRNRLGAYSSGFRPLKNIKISPVGTSIRTETMYDDSNQVRPLGIAVIEKTLVDTSAAKAGYLLVQLGVINKTNAKISKLRVGAFLDFDMTAAGTTDRGGIIRDSTNV